MNSFVVARVFRRGVFLPIDKHILASKKASYKFPSAVARKLHASQDANKAALSEKIEDLFIPLEGRNQVSAANPRMACGARPVEQVPRQGKTMVARGGSRGFELLQ